MLIWILSLLCLFNVRAQVGIIPDLPNEVVLPLTYRDFLPATCAYVTPHFDPRVPIDRRPEGLATAAKVNEAWGVLQASVDRLNTCNIYASAALPAVTVGSRLIYQELLLSQTIEGHPDFESRDKIEEAVQCDNSFPAASCAFRLIDNEFDIDIKLSIIQQELIIGSNGLGKPVYCSDEDGDDTVCGFVEKGGIIAGRHQSKKKYFDLWYTDDLAFNKRVGQNLVLRADPDNIGSFTFNSTIEQDDPDTGTDNVDLQHFGPLGRFTLGDDPIVSNEVTSETEVLDAPVWPRSIIDVINEDLELDTVDKTFYFTSELHTTFEFRSNSSMLFSFSGDDDFWAFVNNKLVIDLGGIHKPLEASIDLNDKDILIENQTLQEFLGLVDGEIATLDVFHAERQTSNSNFALTTTLFPACNVLLSGTNALEATGVDFLDAVKLGNNVEYLAETREIILQRAGRPFSTGFFFTRQQQNVGRGFQATFQVKLSDITEGFAFVVQAQGVIDFPVLAGPTFGIQGLQNSFAVVFDLCANRDEIDSLLDCGLQTVSVHHPDSPEAGNSFSLGTRRTFDFITRRLTRDEYFPIEIVHFGGRPNFLEVYVNQSLYLRETDFGIERILGGTGAHVGITATSSDVSANVVVKDFSFRTVEVNPISSEIDAISFEFEEIVANGEDITDGILFLTNDACANGLESGTLQDLFDVRFVQIPESTDEEDENEDDVDRNLQSTEVNIETGIIQDNDDGSYNLQLQTEVPGSYRVVIAFGAGCSIAERDGEFILDPAPGVTEEDCFFDRDFNRGAPVVVVNPFEEVVNGVDTGDEDAQNVPLAVIGSVSGCCFLCLVFILALFLNKRNKWFEEKVYVPTGELFKTEMETKFDPQNVYTTTGKEVLNTQKEILELQTHQALNDRHKEIIGLRTENEELKEVLRVNKIGIGRQQNTGGARNSFEENFNNDIQKKPRKTEF